jgi:hypothetical protein
MTSFASVTILRSTAVLISTLICAGDGGLDIAGLAVSVGYVCLRIGVAQRCQIAESECLGATATSYFDHGVMGPFRYCF